MDKMHICDALLDCIIRCNVSFAYFVYKKKKKVNIDQILDVGHVGVKQRQSSNTQGSIDSHGEDLWIVQKGTPCWVKEAVPTPLILLQTGDLESQCCRDEMYLEAGVMGKMSLPSLLQLLGLLDQGKNIQHKGKSLAAAQGKYRHQHWCATNSR